MAGCLPTLGGFAVPAVCFLIFFLSYTSQYLFYYIQPGPLSRDETLLFNGCVLAIWWCYDRACTVDPGQRGWTRKLTGDVDEDESEATESNESGKRMRWCKKCEAVKPPRAHHCRKCGRCIPKMDHHCPWTANCVSHTTFPHFIRFIFYAVLSMSILAYHLWARIVPIWNDRDLPAYMGPPAWAMAHLIVLMVLNSLTLFALSVLLIQSVHSLAVNTTTIEGWEIDKHEALVKRSRKSGGYVYANGGQRIRVEHQEFPYDIGIWRNLCQGMGTSIVPLWFLPFAPGPEIETAADFEVNEFEDPSKVWPPPDPDKMTRASRPVPIDPNLEMPSYKSAAEEIAAFKKRQEADFARRRIVAAREASEKDNAKDNEELTDGD